MLTSLCLAAVVSPAFGLTEFAKLSDGTVAYELTGPESGELVVLVHGVSGPMMVWDKTVPALNAAGFRTLRFDLYGRGASDRLDPRGVRTDRIKYDLELYLRELSELLFHLGVQEPFHLIGSSMGAIVSSEYALRNPGSVKKIVLSGPAGFDLEASGSGLEKNRYVRRFMPEVIKQMLIMRQNRKYFYEPWRFEEFLLTYKQQLEIKGSTDAILSTLVFSPVQSYERRYMDLARMNVPVLIVWGKEDVAFPFENSAKLRLAIPRAEFLPVEKAAHLPQYEQPAVTNQRYSEFLTNR